MTRKTQWKTVKMGWWNGFDIFVVKYEKDWVRARIQILRRRKKR